MPVERNDDASPETLARRYYEIVRLEFELAEEFDSDDGSVLRSIDHQSCDVRLIMGLLERAEAAWIEAGRPHLTDRDWVLGRLGADVADA